MQRREMLKALGIVPFVRLPYKETEIPAVQVATRKYWLFVDPNCIDVEAMCSQPIPWPNIDVEIFVVRPRSGMKVEDVLAIYELDAKDEKVG
jgi:hypothetical protein